MKVITDGRAQEIIQTKFKTKDITPEGNILEAAGTLGSPDAGLIDASEEAGADMFFSATFPEVPRVMVADYYGGSCLLYLQKLKERNLPNPAKICVMDQEAKRIIIERFPELTDSIEVTGQPAFDRFANEDTKKIAGEVKEELGIKPNEKLVTLMSAMEPMEFVRQIAEQLSTLKGFKFTFRRHPRDNTPLADYEKIFVDLGIDYVGTMEMPTSSIGAASDLVINKNSTEGLNAIYRRKPSINITDPKFIESPEDVMPPSVKLGASIGVDKMEDLAACVEKLLNPKSKENKDLNKNMDKYYPVDGKNSKRVVDVLKKVLNK